MGLTMSAITESHILELFPTVVTIYDSNIDTKPIYNKIVELIKNGEHADKKTPQIWQSMSGQDKHDEIKQLEKFIIDCAQDYADKNLWDIRTEDWYIADCWWNASTGSSTTHFNHIHANSLLSAVFYVSVPEGAGSLVFPHPLLSAHSFKPNNKGWNIRNSLEYAIKPKNGTCIVFKSSTPHLVEQNSTSELRISIGFTLNIKNLGKGSHLASYEPH